MKIENGMVISVVIRTSTTIGSAHTRQARCCELRKSPTGDATARTIEGPAPVQRIAFREVGCVVQPRRGEAEEHKAPKGLAE
jgi:hypothetical protein